MLNPDPSLPELTPAVTVCLSLISHTNVGKTTLARTLLRRDIGQVLDSEHVTDIAEAHTMVELPAEPRHRLLLWDTPGFGDSARLSKRLKRSNQPIRGFLLETWDRFRNRALWCSQQAVKNVQEEADLVIYLIDATQRPGDNPFVAVEMDILQWIGKPVIVLLNQLGAAATSLGSAAHEEMALWSRQLAKFPIVKDVLALDAFTQCWIQEGKLLDSVAPHLPEEKQAAYQALKAARTSAAQAIFLQATQVLAKQLTESLLDREPAPKETIIQKFGLGRKSIETAMTQAHAALGDRLTQRSLLASDQLISLHHLAGRREEVLANGDKNSLWQPLQVNENLWSAVGGILTGAAAGVAAEIKTGGLMLGGGAIVGIFAGGAGAYLLAKGYNLSKAGKSHLRWTEEHFLAQTELALLFYLAVSHWGRGRGDWQETTSPSTWKAAVQLVVNQARKPLGQIWKAAGDSDSTAATILPILQTLMGNATQSLLRELYPEFTDNLEPPGNAEPQLGVAPLPISI